jgi:hypothetical protein
LDKEKEKLTRMKYFHIQGKGPALKRVLLRLVDGLQSDAEERNWISEQCIEVNTYDMGEDMGHTETEVKIAFPMSHNSLTRVEEYIK